MCRRPLDDDVATELLDHPGRPVLSIAEPRTRGVREVDRLFEREDVARDTAGGDLDELDVELVA